MEVKNIKLRLEIKKAILSGQYTHQKQIMDSLSMKLKIGKRRIYDELNTIASAEDLYIVLKVIKNL
jgi:hypothetical protein